MMGIYDDKVEQIDLKGQLKPFNINQLDRVMHIIGQEDWGWTHLQSQQAKSLRFTTWDSHQTGWNTLPLLSNLICFRSTKT